MTLHLTFFSGILSDIYSDTIYGIYLTCILSAIFFASYLAFDLPDMCILPLYLSFFLAFYLTFHLASYLTYDLAQCAGPAEPMRAGDTARGRRRTRACIKPRDLHLAGGEREIHCASLGPTPMNFCQETLLDF